MQSLTQIEGSKAMDKQMSPTTVSTADKLNARVRLCRLRTRAHRSLSPVRTSKGQRWMPRSSAYIKALCAAFALVALTLLINESARAQESVNPKTHASSVTGEQPSTSEPAPMPQDVPTIAEDYEAPGKPLPPVERVGVDASDPLPLTLNEAIRLALENNNDIDASRIDVEMSEQELKAARGVYDVRFTSETLFERSTTPVTSFLGGNTSGKVKQTDVTGKLGFGGYSPWAGGTYQFDFSSTRLSTNDFFNGLTPSFSSSFRFSYTQPLMRGRRTDDNRRQIEIAKKNLSLTDVQFRQRATEVITNVEQNYWELVYALRNLQVQMDAVRQARAQVLTNQRQVKQGVLAPIDVIEAEAQVKEFEQQVYKAQENVTTAENNLKTLLLPDRNDSMWTRALVPVTPVNLEAPRMTLAEATSSALANRLELAELQTNADVNQINTRYYRDQAKAQVDLTASYSSNGLAGAFNDNSDNPLFNNLAALERRLNELSAIAGLPNLPTTAIGTLPEDLNGGYGQSLGNMLGQNNPTISVGVRVSLPFKNRTAKARVAYSLAEGRRIETLKVKAGQIIEADVRNTMQAVRSIEARLAAAAAARVAAEQQYTSERRRFQSGMSTLFLVLERQTDLVTAKGHELQAQTDLNKALANFQRAMGNTFQYRSVAVRTDGQGLLQLSQTDADTNAMTPQPRAIAPEPSATTPTTPSNTKTISQSSFTRSQQ